MFSLHGDTVLDPFLGTGTTMLAAMMSGRNSMGIEREQSFDVLALIQEVSDMNNGGHTQTGQARMRCQVLLNDGSLKEDNSKFWQD